MDNLDNILDHHEDQYRNPEIYLASTGQRLANYLIDRTGVFVSLFLMFSIFGNSFLDSNDDISGFGIILMLSSIFGYWILFEFFLGKTPGKFITGTKVVTKYGERPSILTIIGRTLCRFIPFEPFSFLGSQPIGWHDSITGTRVVTDNFKKRDDFI